MGYELRLHLGQEFLGTEEFNKKYGATIEQIAVVELSGIGYESALKELVLKRQTAQEAAILGGAPRYRIHTDAHTEATNEYESLFEDKYDKPITPIPLREVYAALLRDYADSLTPGHKSHYRDGYRRYALAIPVFEAVLNRFPEIYDMRGNVTGRALVALTYGH